MIVRRVAREDAWKVVAYTVVLAANMVATVLAFPTFEANYGLILNLVPGFLSFVKEALANAGKGGFPAFAAINHFFKGANVVGPAMAIVLALGTIVREVEIGTIGLLLSRPRSRLRTLASFAAVHLVELIVPILLVSALVPWTARTFIGRDLPLGPMLAAAAYASAFVALVYAIALLCAVVFTEQIRVAAVAGGVCIVSFMLFFVDATRPYTLYALSSFDVYTALVRGAPFPWTGCATTLACAAAAFAAAYAVFARRDY